MQVVLLVLGGTGWLAPCSGRAMGRGGSALPCLETPSLEGRELCKAQGCWFGGSAAELVVLLWAFCVLFLLLGVMDGTACPHRGCGEREEAIRDARGEERHRRAAHGAHGPSPLHGHLVGRQVPGTVMGGWCCHVGPHAIPSAAWPCPCVLLSLWVGGHPFSGFWRAVPSTELSIAGLDQPLSPLVPRAGPWAHPHTWGESCGYGRAGFWASLAFCQVTGDRNKLILVWEAATCKRLHTFTGHRDAVSVSGAVGCCRMGRKAPATGQAGGAASSC